MVRPNGDGSSAILGGDDWTISVGKSQKAKTKSWVVVERIRTMKSSQVERRLAFWKRKEPTATMFDTGTMFAVSGAIVDNRETVIAIWPGATADVKSKVEKAKLKFGVPATTYEELVSKPKGVITARSAKATVANPSILWFFPTKGTIWVEGVTQGGGGSQKHTKQVTRKYRGAIYATVGDDGNLTVGNAIGAETLLEGLVPAEIYPDAPQAALKSQAIAARTELLQKLGRRHHTKPFLLCSTQQCQVYAGAGAEDPRTTKAVKQTRGVTMVANRKLVDARYSAACGGHTEDKHAIWGGDVDPVLSAKNDMAYSGPPVMNRVGGFLKKRGAYCGVSKWSRGRYRWNKHVHASEIEANLKSRGMSIGTLVSITPLQRLKSGRLSSVKMQGSHGESVIRGDLNIRRALGNLRSSLFLVTKRGPDFVFSGAGFGHGVGMCQLGAIGMAEKGISHQRILKHYYSGISLQKLY